jgi:tetratricopeptide (TPR) repeat protein
MYRSALRIQALRVVSETLDEYAQSMSLSPNEMPAKQALYQATEGMDLQAEYLNLLRLAVQFVPDFAEAHYEMACELRNQNSRTQAFEHFTKAALGRALVISGPYDAPVLYKARLEMGKQLLDQGKLEEAVEHLSIATRAYGGAERIREDQAFPEANRVLAQTLRHLGRYSEAAEHFSLALVYRPTVPEIPSLPLELQYSTVTEKHGETG